MHVELDRICQEAETAVDSLQRAVADENAAVILDNLALGPPDADLDGSQQEPGHEDAVVLSQWRLAACSAMKYSFRKDRRIDLFGRRNSEVRKSVEEQAGLQSQHSLEALRNGE